MKKRGFCFFLLFVLLVTAVVSAIPVSAAESGLKNVALGAKYESSAPYVLDADQYAGDNYRNKDYDELTDGIKGSTAVGDEWYAFQGASNYYITVDLGKTVSDLARVEVEFCNKADWAIVLPAEVKASGSADGKTYTDLGTLKDSNEGDTSAYHAYMLDFEGAYRYIRIDITPSGFFTFVSEVEVLAGYIAEMSITSGNAYIEGSQIYGLSAETSVEEFYGMLNTASGVKIKSSAGKEKTSGVMATGDTVSKRDENGEYSTSYTVIIDGDLNYDGKVNGNDYIRLKRYVLKTAKLGATELLAADIDKDGKVVATDYIMVKRHVLRTFNIYEKYEPEPVKDGRGDVTEEFADMDTTDRIETLESYSMTVKRTGDTVYSITCETEDGTLLLTLYRTAWGTYNLGKWQLTDKSGTMHDFISGSTDWEYVYRVAESANAGLVWSGGNHDNEQMVSLAFYLSWEDAIAQKEFELAVGESQQVNQLVILESTKLYWGDASDGYSEDENYAEALRMYTIVGPQIRLEVRYKYLKDTYYGTSYTCMFPINKKYGLYCAFLDDEELLHVAETFKVGDPSYNGAFHGNAASDRCIMWGYDGMEKYKFDVRVLTPETSCNNFDNDMKVAFWDMNAGSNKLYFSKCDVDSYTKVPAGTETTTVCQWTFYIDE